MTTARRTLILGAAGRDFHNFLVALRDDPTVEVVGFTAAQIPGIGGRRLPASLAGPRYPDGIPIDDEARLEALCSARARVAPGRARGSRSPARRRWPLGRLTPTAGTPLPALPDGHAALAAHRCARASPCPPVFGRLTPPGGPFYRRRRGSGERARA